MRLKAGQFGPAVGLGSNISVWRDAYSVRPSKDDQARIVWHPPRQSWKKILPPRLILRNGYPLRSPNIMSRDHMIESGDQVQHAVKVVEMAKDFGSAIIQIDPSVAGFIPSPPTLRATRHVTPRSCGYALHPAQ